MTTKNKFNCKCHCCIYWRRHVHRVAANSDRRTKAANNGRHFQKKMHNYYLGQCHKLWREEKVTKAEIKELEKKNANLTRERNSAWAVLESTQVKLDEARKAFHDLQNQKSLMERIFG